MRWLVILPDYKRRDRSPVAGRGEVVIRVSKVFQRLGSGGVSRKGESLSVVKEVPLDKYLKARAECGADAI